MHFIRCSICNNRRIAEIAYMVRTSSLIQYQVPIQVSFCPRIEISNHVSAVAFASKPFPQLNAALLAALCEQQMLVRK
ncbi:hypothetical protein D3C71_1634460 [compost metagenome]